MTGLEFSYTQAPDELKSWVMALYLASISVGNAITAAVNAAITRPDGSARLSDVEYMQFFTSLMLIAALLFLPVIFYYDDEAAATAASSRCCAAEQPVEASNARNGSCAGLLRGMGAGGSSAGVSDVESTASSAAVELGSPDSAAKHFRAFPT